MHYLNLQKGDFFMGLKTVVLNSERMNYDGKLDLSVLSSQVKEYASTEPDSESQFLHADPAGNAGKGR